MEGEGEEGVKNPGKNSVHYYQDTWLMFVRPSLLQPEHVACWAKYNNCGVWYLLIFTWKWHEHIRSFFKGGWTNDQLAWKRKKMEDQDIGHARSQSNEWTFPWKQVCSSWPRSWSLVLLLEQTPMVLSCVCLLLESIHTNTCFRTRIYKRFQRGMFIPQRLLGATVQYTRKYCTLEFFLSFLYNSHLNQVINELSRLREVGVSSLIRHCEGWLQCAGYLHTQCIYYAFNALH